MKSSEVRIPAVELRKIILNSLDVIYRDENTRYTVYVGIMSKIEDDIRKLGYMVEADHE